MAWLTYNTQTGALVQVSDYELSVIDGLTMTTHPLSKSALEAEYQWDVAALDFKPKTGLSAAEFLDRFTTQERVDIRTRAKTDPIVEDAIAQLNAMNSNEKVSLSSARVASLLAYFVSLGDLTEARRTEILGG